MFTGLVRALGHLRFLSQNQVQITAIEDPAPDFLQTLELGESVAVDGICLTVETQLANGFVAAASPETLGRTTLGRASWGGTSQEKIVNLEPSLRVGDKLGGHFVTGHIDGVGAVAEIRATGAAWELAFEVKSPQVARYIVPKGSIAVNGISLTVAHCNDQGTYFTVAVIPHTFDRTNLHYLQVGHGVNLEGDILGKYVEKLLMGQSGAMASGLDLGQVLTVPRTVAVGGMASGVTVSDVTIDQEFLAEHGYT
jgi:riboflavin synthase